LQVIYLSGAESSAGPGAGAAPGDKPSGKKKKGGSGVPTDPSKYYISSLAGNLPTLHSSESINVAGVFVLYGSADVVTALKEPLCALIGGKGGGRPGKLQGTGERLQMVGEVDSLIRSQFRTVK
jgi:hypothetical protein